MDKFIGQITLFGCNFAPQGWAVCQGQTLPIGQNAALFSLLGNKFGGNGTSNFQLPDLRGRLPNGMGQGTGMSANYALGGAGGVELVSLNPAQIPPHTHAFPAYAGEATTTDPTNALPAAGPASGGRQTTTAMDLYNTAAPNVVLSGQQVGPTEGGSATQHTNIQPVLALNWCIALTGTFPPRS